MRVVPTTKAPEVNKNEDPSRVSATAGSGCDLILFAGKIKCITIAKDHKFNKLTFVILRRLLPQTVVPIDDQTFDLIFEKCPYFSLNFAGGCFNKL
jgi:hypothetical protein